MEKISETIRFREFLMNVDRQLYVAVKEDLTKQSKDMCTDLEKMYRQLASRINFLLADRVSAIEAHTEDDTLKENESGSVHSNLGATGTITLTLPDEPTKGTHFYFAVQAAQELRIDPGEATIRDDSGQTADKYKTANAVGESIHLVADENGDWLTISKYGTWTEEP